MPPHALTGALKQSALADGIRRRYRGGVFFHAEKTGGQPTSLALMARESAVIRGTKLRLVIEPITETKSKLRSEHNDVFCAISGTKIRAGSYEYTLLMAFVALASAPCLSARRQHQGIWVPLTPSSSPPTAPRAKGFPGEGRAVVGRSAYGTPARGARFRATRSHGTSDTLCPQRDVHGPRGPGRACRCRDRPNNRTPFPRKSLSSRRCWRRRAGS